jgi:hypothetical protein
MALEDGDVKTQQKNETRMVYVGYRYIPPEERMTPLMHLPIQRTCIEVDAPYGEYEIKLALMRDYPGWFRYDELRIEDFQVA